MSSEEHNKLTNEEKFKLNEFYNEDSDLWVTQGITRSQKGLKKEELVEQLDREFSIEILECQIKVGNSKKACFS